MCTSIFYKNGKYSYFGRNLDLQYAMGEKPTVVPRNYEFKFRHLDSITQHPAIVGMALTVDNYPLLFEGFNEWGVGIAGLNFPGFAKYNPNVEEGKTNLTPFELIPYLLSKCKSVADLKAELENINLIDESFSQQYPVSPLHWQMADKESSIVVERTEDGLKVYDNPINVLTNAPEYPANYYNFCNYMNLTGHYPTNRMNPDLPLKIYSSAMGSFGLPGGMDSMSRFVKAGFTVNTSRAEETDVKTMTQFFHCLKSVNQSDGTNQTEDTLWEITLYSCGANLETMDFYWNTYYNNQINCIKVKELDLDHETIMSFDVCADQNINYVR